MVNILRIWYLFALEMMRCCYCCCCLIVLLISSWMWCTFTFNAPLNQIAEARDRVCTLYTADEMCDKIQNNHFNIDFCCCCFAFVFRFSFGWRLNVFFFSSMQKMNIVFAPNYADFVVHWTRKWCVYSKIRKFVFRCTFFRWFTKLISPNCNINSKSYVD